MVDLDPRCVCGHTRSDHDADGTCQAPDMNVWPKQCPCKAFRPDEEAA